MADLSDEDRPVKVRRPPPDRTCDPFERGQDDFRKRRPSPPRPPDDKQPPYTDEEIRWFGWMVARARVLQKMFEARQKMGDYRDLPIDERNIVPSDGSDPNDDPPPPRAA